MFYGMSILLWRLATAFQDAFEENSFVSSRCNFKHTAKVLDLSKISFCINSTTNHLVTSSFSWLFCNILKHKLWIRDICYPKIQYEENSKLDFRNTIVTCNMNYECGTVNQGSHNDIELFIKGYSICDIIIYKKRKLANNILMVFRKWTIMQGCSCNLRTPSHLSKPNKDISIGLKKGLLCTVCASRITIAWSTYHQLGWF